MKFLAIVLLIMSAVVFAACDDRGPAEREAARQANRLETSAGLLNSMFYFRDDRAQPAICYAYLWKGQSHGGPALATVPCEAVEHLLINR